MAHTLLDIAKLNGSDAVVGLIEEVVTSAPEVNVLPARTIRGTSYKTVSRTGYPAVGFRQANGAATAGQSTFVNRLVECFVLSALCTVDKAVAQAYEDGVAAWQAMEATGVARQVLIEIGQQIWYGTNTTFGGNSNGFPGFLQTYDSTNMVVDAGGTTDNVSTSVWLVSAGNQDVQLLLGNNTTLQLSDWREETPSNVPSYVADLTGWVGLQVVNPNSVCRIKKVTTDSGKTLSDSLIAQAIAKFPVGKQPTHIFMNRRSRMQLHTARTVTLFGGPGPSKPAGSVEVIAPMPTEAFGIPIIVTDNIVSTETLAS
ncbi:MAG: hypothetical protein E6Q97_15110 [Desulfurellales bacterium]|nr:MAG: hypothetical protein E6Q97_15110 [Desulfurellales bacterium]